MPAATELAGTINNDVPAPVGNITDNNDDDEQLIDAAPVQNFGNHANNNYPPDVVNEQLNVAAPVENVGNHANNNDPPYVVDEQSNDAAAPIRKIAVSIDNNDQGINVDAAPVRNIANSMDNNEQLIEAVVGNGNIETHYAAIHNDGTTLMVPTINYLNDQLELRDKRIRELEAKIVDLERMMTALSEAVGDFKCTSV